MLKKNMQMIIGIGASVLMSSFSQIVALGDMNQKVSKFSAEQTEKMCQELEKLQELGYSEKQIMTILHETVARAAENGDTEIEITNETRKKCLLFFVGYVAVMLVLVGAYSFYTWYTTPRVVRVARDFAGRLINLMVRNPSTERMNRQMAELSVLASPLSELERAQLAVGMQETLAEVQRREPERVASLQRPLREQIALIFEIYEPLPARIANIVQQNASLDQLTQQLNQDGRRVMQNMVAGAQASGPA